MSFFLCGLYAGHDVNEAKLEYNAFILEAKIENLDCPGHSWQRDCQQNDKYIAYRSQEGEDEIYSSRTAQRV
jgi:hypothetical protein